MQEQNVLHLAEQDLLLLHEQEFRSLEQHFVFPAKEVAFQKEARKATQALREVFGTWHHCHGLGMGGLEAKCGF